MTVLQTVSGAKKQTWVYVVDGASPEPLLGDTDTEELGVVTFHLEGREATAVQSISILEKLRKAGIEVRTERPEPKKITKQGREEAWAIVKEYMGSVFSDKIGNMKIPPVQLQYEQGFRPTQLAHYPVPYHYQSRLGEHLKQLK